MLAFRPWAVIRHCSHPRERGPCSPLTRPLTLLAISAVICMDS